MTVEVFHTEMSDIMERLHFGVPDQRNSLNDVFEDIPKYPALIIAYI
jgi:hypothetical protein